MFVLTISTCSGRCHRVDVDVVLIATTDNTSRSTHQQTSFSILRGSGNRIGALVFVVARESMSLT